MYYDNMNTQSDIIMIFTGIQFYARYMHFKLNIIYLSKYHFKEN